MPDRSWTLLQSRQVSDHRIFRVREDIYRFEPSGVERDFVVLDSPDWANIVPLTDDGRVILVRQFRHGVQTVTTEIPGGIVDPGEQPEAAAVRELREETGYTPRRVRSLGRVRPNPAIMGNYCYMFVAEGCRRTTEPRPDPFEQIEVLSRPVEDVPELVRREEISHTLIINALAMAGLLAEREQA